MSKVIHVNGAEFCDDQFPVLSTIGRGPVGPKGDKGDTLMPTFADPIQWSTASDYEELTIVTNDGSTYVSKRYVPAGVDIANQTYWVKTADFNAQLAEAQQAIAGLDGDLEDERQARVDGDSAEAQARQDAIDDIEALLPAASFSSTDTVKKYVDDAVDRLELQDEAIQARNILVIGDSWSDLNSSTVENGVNWTTIWQEVNPGDNIYNFAKAGMGLLSGSIPFNTQVSNAAADASFDNDKIDLVIIVGDVNDWDAGYTNPTQNYSPALRTLANNIKGNFENAQVYWFFASCARPLSANADRTGNWSDMLDLNSQLVRYINIAMPNDLASSARSYNKMHAYNITHMFTEQTFKPWGETDYLKHITMYGQWQLYRSIEHAIATGESPEMLSMARLIPPDSNDITRIFVTTRYTAERRKSTIVLTTKRAISANEQIYIELPNSAFMQQSVNTPTRFNANYDDMFPPKASALTPLMYNTSPDNYNPLLAKCAKMQITRAENTPAGADLIAFFGSPLFSSYPHGVLLKATASASNVLPAKQYFGTFEMDISEYSYSYLY